MDLTAVIDEQVCIGCGICLNACVFDAIIGAPGQMHTVLVEECIGCKLCINPCPVHCIKLSEIDLLQFGIKKKQIIAKAKQRRIAKQERIKSNLMIAMEVSKKNKELIQQELDNILLKKR